MCACVFVMSDASSPLANRLMLWHSCEAMSWWPCSDVLRHHCLWPQHNCCWHKTEHMERECLCTSHDFRTLSLTYLWFNSNCSVAVPDRYLYFKPVPYTCACVSHLTPLFFVTTCVIVATFVYLCALCQLCVMTANHILRTANQSS